MLNSTTPSSAARDLSVSARIRQPRQEVYCQNNKPRTGGAECLLQDSLNHLAFLRLYIPVKCQPSALLVSFICPPHFVPEQRSCVCLPPALCWVGEHRCSGSAAGGVGASPQGTPAAAGAVHGHHRDGFSYNKRFLNIQYFFASRQHHWPEGAPGKGRTQGRAPGHPGMEESPLNGLSLQCRCRAQHPPPPESR